VLHHAVAALVQTVGQWEGLALRNLHRATLALAAGCGFAAFFCVWRWRGRRRTTPGIAWTKPDNTSIRSESPSGSGITRLPDAKGCAGSGRVGPRAGRLMKRVAAVAGIFLAFVALAVAAFLVSENLHAVSPGQVYRSRQLAPAELEDVVARYGIRGVLNLRGRHKDSQWYQEERRTLHRLGVSMVDHELSAGREVAPSELDALVRELACQPKPVLIHCEGGADRSGLVSAAWLLRREGQGPDQAGKQLSLRFGHFPWLWSNSGAMDRSFARYATWLHHAEPLPPCP